MTQTISANLCKCNNCGSVLIDENPQYGAVFHPVPTNAIEMEYITNDDGSFWACPNCQTDEYLIDL